MVGCNFFYICYCFSFFENFRKKGKTSCISGLLLVQLKASREISDPRSAIVIGVEDYMYPRT